MNVMVLFLGYNDVGFVMFKNSHILYSELKINPERQLGERASYLESKERITIKSMAEAGFYGGNSSIIFNILPINYLPMLKFRAKKIVFIKNFDLSINLLTRKGKEGLDFVCPNREMSKILILEKIFNTYRLKNEELGEIYRFEKLIEKYYEE